MQVLVGAVGTVGCGGLLDLWYDLNEHLYFPSSGDAGALVVAARFVGVVHFVPGFACEWMLWLGWQMSVWGCWAVEVVA